jgi:poly-gamma-glutamate capsule biosynthesis protein CapA/YwtB (metallophosphatase superfamily)
MDTLTLWLAGDVMTGRGIDQIQAHCVAPVLYESWVRDARCYVRLAERVNGHVPAPVTPDYIWGDALAEIDRRQPDLRLINLETAITSSDQAWSGKGIHYRMHPANIGCLTAARIDCCALANNHALDWGRAGLDQTLQTLQQAGIQSAGAGPDAASACTPAVLPLAGGARLLVYSWAGPDSGVPHAWAATRDSSGVAVLPDWSEASAQQVAMQVLGQRRPGDRVVVSLHWGSNWGYEVPQQHRFFARRLIELGAADVIHGHSSHHPRPVEVYRGRLIIYGCGDLINDYEGITFQEGLDPSGVCLYFAQISRESGALQQFDIVPMQLRRLRLIHANPNARRNLRWLLDTEGRRFSKGLQTLGDGSWRLHC